MHLMDSLSYYRIQNASWNVWDNKIQPSFGWSWTVALQALERARNHAKPGQLLGSDVQVGPYGDRFWTRVALATPGRTVTECLDAYIALRRSPVARFSASGRSLADIS